jgi:hypothetical protein
LPEAFKDIGSLLLDGKRDIGWFEARSHQSTSETKIAGGKRMDKSRSAHFVKFGNYFENRKNSGKTVVLLR